MRLAAFSLVLAACGPGLPEVVDPRDVRDSSGAPTLSRVRDLGGRAARFPGPLGGDRPGDDVATIGELLLLSGNNLGRLPTVTIGRRPTEIEAFTTDGIVVRVPPGAPAGEQPILVEHAGGRAERRVVVRRWAVVLADGRATFVSLGGKAPQVGAIIDAPGARAVRFSADAAVAYILGDRLTVVDMAAQRAPNPVAIRDLPIAADHLAVARGRGAGRAVLVARDAIAMIDVSDAQRPAFWARRALPLATQATAAEMDDSGKVLALLSGNRVSLVDISDVAAPVAGATVDLSPGVDAPLGTQLRYSGSAVWALLGGNPRNAATGVQPVRLVRVQGNVVDAAIDIAASGDAVGIALQDSRRVSGSTIHASAMTPLWVACNAGQQGSILRVDGDGAVLERSFAAPLLSMDGAAGAALGVACYEARLVLLHGADGTLDLDAACPSSPASLAVQP